MPITFINFRYNVSTVHLHGRATATGQQAMTPQGQHFVYVSTPTPQTVQDVPMGYTQTVQGKH